MTQMKLHAIVKTATKQLLEQALQDEEIWKKLSAKLRRTGLSETVTFEQWAKFKWSRHPVDLDRAALLSCSEKQAKAIYVVSENLSTLLAREMSESSLFILESLNAEWIDRALSELWLNQLTADAVARLILRTAIQKDVDAAVSAILK